MTLPTEAIRAYPCQSVEEKPLPQEAIRAYPYISVEEKPLPQEAIRAYPYISVDKNHFLRKPSVPIRAYPWTKTTSTGCTTLTFTAYNITLHFVFYQQIIIFDSKSLNPHHKTTMELINKDKT